MKLEELKRLAEQSTKVVAWYAHSQYDGYHPGKASVRGPFGRWFLVEEGGGWNKDEPKPVADLFDDAKYAAAAMNALPALIERVERLTDALEQLAEPARDIDWTAADLDARVTQMAGDALERYGRDVPLG